MCVCSRLTRAGSRPRCRVRRERLVQPRGPAECGQVNVITSGCYMGDVGDAVTSSSVKLLEVPQHFGDAPGLCDAAARSIGLLRVEDLADRPDAGLDSGARRIRRARAARLRSIAGMHFQPGVDDTGRSARPRRSPDGRRHRASGGRRSTSACSRGAREPAIADPTGVSSCSRTTSSTGCPSRLVEDRDARARSPGSDWAGTPDRFRAGPSTTSNR